MLHLSKNRPGMIAALLLPAALLAAMPSGQAQTKYQSATGVNITVEGTSNIHDWEMKAEKASVTAVFTLSPANTITSVGTVSFVMQAQDLKSEHKAMDKNAYNAMHTDKAPTISFVASSATLQPGNNKTVSIVARGKLTISGVTKDVTLSASGIVNADKTISCTGAYKLKMTDYNVEPPSIMFGTIKTGDDLTIRFNALLRAS